LTDTTPAFQKIKDDALSHLKELQARQKTIIMVGTATCGRAAGAMEVLQAIREELDNNNLDASLLESGCMGHCYAEPIVTIGKPGLPPIIYGYVTPEIAHRLVKDYVMGEDCSLEFALGAWEENDLVPPITYLPRYAYEKHILLQNCGRFNPEDIDHYIGLGGYEGLARALRMQPAQIIQEMKRSGLRGRGGAGFSTGEKWDVCYSTPGKTKYVICNADEGDPGAFMDRAILEGDPHSVLEGLVVVGYTMGARKGYIYVRAEYPLAVQRIMAALRQARSLNLLGKNILGSDFSFDIKVFKGSGAFVCGEETALIASIEGNPGMPRHRPPFPAASGLWGKPTCIDNVKTLAYVPHIISKGADWFSNIGTDGSKGTAVFALAGKVVNTGLTEVPMGTTLRQIIFDIGGGIPKGKKFKAVQIGGPSGGCLPESALDLPVDFDSLEKAGAMMGSGGMVVMDEDDCMVEVARYFLEFTQRESCGKCTMCRIGTKQMLEILQDISEGRGKPEDLVVLEDLASDVKQGSLCGLGRTAPNPVLSTLRYFRDEYEAHIKDKCCPAMMCPSLIAYYILPDKCQRSCDACVGNCAVEAIASDRKRIKVIDQQKCTKCGVCVAACPPQYNAVIKLTPPDKVPRQ